MDKSVKEEIRKGAGFAALSYVFFLCIFVLIYKKDNQFARYHAKQGLVIFIGLMGCWFLAAVIEHLHLLIFSILGGLINVSGTLIYLVCAVIGIFSSLMGAKTKFPIISDIARKLII